MTPLDWQVRAISLPDSILRGLQISGVTVRGENAGCPGNRAVDCKEEPLAWRKEDPWPKESGGCRGEETAGPLLLPRGWKQENRWMKFHWTLDFCPVERKIGSETGGVPWIHSLGDAAPKLGVFKQRLDGRFTGPAGVLI